MRPRHYTPTVLSGHRRSLPFLLGGILTAGGAQISFCQTGAVPFPLPDSSAAAITTKYPLLMPDKAQKAMTRAREQYTQGHFESAQKDVQQALAVCPHCELVLTLEAILDLQLGKKKDATRAFERA